MINHRLSLLTSALVLALGLSAPVIANETASNVKGHITNTQGQALTDVTISIIHQPTGAIKKVKVDNSGNFNVRGLRVGGPYKIIIDSETLADDTLNNVFLNVGETLRINRSLEQKEQIETITVVADPNSVAVLGDSRYFGEKAIENAPTINRDIKDILRQNPFVSVNPSGTRLSVAGLNPKFNTFVVDGISQNDDFGLSSNGYPGQRSPISLDAVESVALDIAPFSTRYGGFSGAQINLVTKSGTNEVTGSVYWQRTDDSLSGDMIDGKEVEHNFEETTYGATLGLPIIKDKLFFFGSYEKFDAPQNQIYGPKGAGGFASTSNVSVSDFEEVSAIANEKYGLDSIGVYDAKPEEQDEKLLLKVDWQINDAHRASLTYQYNEGNNVRNLNDETTINTSYYNYDIREEMENYALNIYSSWNDDFSSEFKIAYKDTNTYQVPLVKSGLGAVEILTDNNTDTRSDDGTINFGTDPFRQANQLNNQNLEVYFAGDYQINDHIIGFGFEYNQLEVFNLFAAYAMGEWQFASIEDFRNGVVDGFSYANSASGNTNELGADVDMDTIALFLEDAWSLSDDLEITFGLRYETISMSNQPKLNQNFVDRYGFSNTHTLDGNDILLPRFGFNYQLNDDMTLRGGIGRYSGGKPNVWIANSFSNDGVSLLSYNADWDPSYSLDFAKIPDQVQNGLEGGDGNVNAIDPDFKLPSDWRFNLALDTTWDLGALGDNWFFGSEILYIKNENDLAWKELARTPIGDDGTGRTVYRTIDRLTGESTNRYDILLTNADKDGSSFSWSLNTAKAWENGVNFKASYAYNDAEEGFPGTSSRAISNYQYALTRYDRNSTTLGTSNNTIKHKFTFTLGYETEFFAGYKANMNLFYDIKKGEPMSWVLGSHNDYGLGDQRSLGRSDAYLVYVPSGPNDENIDWENSQLSYDEIMESINSLGLGKYAGSVIPKGTHYQPWTHQLDLSFSQEIPGFTSEHRGLLYFDIRNVLNLINDDWGSVRNTSYNNRILFDHNYAYDSNTGKGKYTYSVPYGQDGVETSTHDNYNLKQSTWQLSVGVKYKF